MEEYIALLQSTRDRALNYFDLDENRLSLHYAAGKWNVRYILCHLADAETVLYERVRRTISNPGQVLWGFEPDLWAEHLGYETYPLGLQKNIFNTVRESVIYLARDHYEGSENKKFVHNETGLRSLKDEFDKIAWHCDHHLKQVEMALEIG